MNRLRQVRDWLGANYSPSFAPLLVGALEQGQRESSQDGVSHEEGDERRARKHDEGDERRARKHDEEAETRQRTRLRAAWEKSPSPRSVPNSRSVQLSTVLLPVR